MCHVVARDTGYSPRTHFFVLRTLVEVISGLSFRRDSVKWKASGDGPGLVISLSLSPAEFLFPTKPGLLLLTDPVTTRSGFRPSEEFYPNLPLSRSIITTLIRFRLTSVFPQRVLHSH